MASSAYRHWSQRTRGWIAGGLLVALGLVEILAVQIMRGRLDFVHFVAGLIPIGFGSMILAYSHGKESEIFGQTTKRVPQDILRAVFDALPSLVFVVDQDMRIQELNAAASELSKARRRTFLKRRAGEMLHCLHSSEVPEGCGRAPFCKNCMIRNSVTEAFRGNRTVRLRTRLELLRDGKKTEFIALITASPFSFQERSRALLVIEDIGEMAGIQRMMSICSMCRKVRDDKEVWMQIEAYFKERWDIDFSHGYCPDCASIEMGKTKLSNKAES
jgi:PAS domain-containing protein